MLHIFVPLIQKSAASFGLVIEAGGGGSHGISLEKALKAAPKVRTLVSIVIPRPSMATAPRGSGCVMIPTMVARKMASRCHAWDVTPVRPTNFQNLTQTRVPAAVWETFAE